MLINLIDNLLIPIALSNYSLIFGSKELVENFKKTKSSKKLIKSTNEKIEIKKTRFNFSFRYLRNHILLISNEDFSFPSVHSGFLIFSLLQNLNRILEFLCSFYHPKSHSLGTIARINELKKLNIISEVFASKLISLIEWLYSYNLELFILNQDQPEVAMTRGTISIENMEKLYELYQIISQLNYNISEIFHTDIISLFGPEISSYSLLSSTSSLSNSVSAFI
jgi:hypothetical protein